MTETMTTPCRWKVIQMETENGVVELPLILPSGTNGYLLYFKPTGKPQVRRTAPWTDYPTFKFRTDDFGRIAIGKDYV